MRAITSMAGKELRALFQSQVAVLFLALFIVANNLTFFVVSRFFARNLADLTPMFEWLPISLIVLVSAVAMRAWAEEEKSGTLEVLLTLPVRTMDLVLGKFLAGMALVAIALATTLPLAFTVAMVGPLDWGPVIGGYLGAMLLAGAYLSIGLCISARTDNQVVALMGTVAVGGLLYLIGTDGVVALLGSSNGQIAAAIGTGSRFESIARGVVDLRDIAYYASLTTFFLVLNGYFLDRRRIDPQGRGQQRLAALRLLVLLTAANALALDVWMHPVRFLRVDLTENQDYTISDVTAGILRELDEPLRIQGIFSERSHPKLQPLAPQLAALLEEYAIVGGDRVTTEILDPSGDDDLADLLEQEFGVRPVPMPVADRNETRIVNSWFHVLLRYGDKHAVVAFNDLVEVEQTDGDFDVRLRDPEYDITKAIKRVTQDFATTESLVAKLPAGSKLLLYATPATLDEMMTANLGVMRKVAGELAAMGDALTFEQIDPSADPAVAERIAGEYG
ncbi:MAG: Gldg family protein, partial [Myxococcales bacterium]|nr:Gldg family protein [Myxococcales bacterium]